MNKKSQTLSMDLMIAIMIFVGMMTLFFGVMMFRSYSTSDKDLNNEGMHIIKSLESEVSVIEDNQIKEEKIHELMEKDYDEIKSELGIRNEFCIFIEDENGKVIPVQNEEGEIYYGVGSGNVEIGEGMVCGQLS